MRVATHRYLNLLREMAVSQFKLKDQSTVLGLLWSLLNPLVTLLVLLLFFSLNAGKGVPHYAIYLLIGIVHYTHFSNCTNSAMAILSNMRDLTVNTIFPKEVLVIGSVVANTVEFVISMAIAVLIAFITGVHISWTILLLPIVIIMQAMTVLWVSFILSLLHVFIRDISHIYQVFLRILFFVTPIFYTPSYVGHGFARFITNINPLAHLIAFSRSLLIDKMPISITECSVFLALNVVAIATTLVFFKNYESRFAEFA